METKLGHFWAGGCFVSTSGQDEVVIGAYIQKQEKGGKQLERLTFGLDRLDFTCRRWQELAASSGRYPAQQVSNTVDGHIPPDGLLRLAS